MRHRDQARAVDKRYYQAHKFEVMRRKESKRYKLSKEAYNLLSLAHEGRCAICHDAPVKGLNVDHCHATGKVRGLLCTGCNTGLGGFRDDIRSLYAAIVYLTKHEVKP